MLYAISHALLKVRKAKKSNATLYTHRLNTQLRELDKMVNNLKLSADLDPDIHSRSIQSSLRLYVDLFYALSRDERKAYIQQFSGKSGKIKPERNLLLIPAIMAEFDQPKDDVSKTLYYSLYRMPFKIFYDSSKDALHLALLEQNMAIKSVPYDTIEDFSQSMAGLSARMKAIETGTINPHDDEDMKASFVEKAIDFSAATEINVVDIISERVGTESARLARMHRLMRRARY